MQNKAHLTLEGLEKIKQIKAPPLLAQRAGAGVWYE